MEKKHKNIETQKKKIGVSFNNYNVNNNNHK